MELDESLPKVIGTICITLSVSGKIPKQNLLSKEPTGSFLPFAYPPFVAIAYYPLGLLNYRLSFFLHTLLMIGTIALAVRVIVNTNPRLKNSTSCLDWRLPYSTTLCSGRCLAGRTHLLLSYFLSWRGRQVYPVENGLPVSFWA